MKHKILCMDGFSGAGLKELEQNSQLELTSLKSLPHQELIKKIAPYSGLIVRSSTQVAADVISAAKNLKIIARAGIGTDNIDIEAATAQGIFVINAPLGNTTSTAELAFTLLLSLARHIPQAAKSMDAGKWEKQRFKGNEVAHKTLAIIGLGRIGQEVAKKALAFKMKVVAHDPFLSEEQFKALNIQPLSLEEIYKSADYITVHTPLNAETENLIGKNEFAMMQPTTCIINCARGGIINEAELAAALKKGQIAGAALDVFTEEPYEKSTFRDLDNCITTPHLGASTSEAQEAVGIEIAGALSHFFAKGFTTSAVNLPAIDSKSLQELQPQLLLAERLGSLAAQLCEGALEQIVFCAAARKPQLLTRAAVKGTLTKISTQPPTFVNALKLAQERSIQVGEEFFTSASHGDDPLGIKLKTSQGLTEVRGTAHANGLLKLTQFNDYNLEMEAKHHLLFIENADQPGIIGCICTILGNHKVNIAQMQNVRKHRGSEALTVIRMDEALPEKTLETIRAEKGVHVAKQASL